MFFFLMVSCIDLPVRYIEYGIAGPIESCTIITTDANEMMAGLHNRMPVILDPQDYDWWIEGDVKEVGQLLTPCPSEWLDAYAVSRKVNSTRNHGPELLELAT